MITVITCLHQKSCNRMHKNLCNFEEKITQQVLWEEHILGRLAFFLVSFGSLKLGLLNGINNSVFIFCAKMPLFPEPVTYIYTDTNPITLLCSLARTGNKYHPDARYCPPFISFSDTVHIPVLQPVHQHPTH